MAGFYGSNKWENVHSAFLMNNIDNLISTDQSQTHKHYPILNINKWTLIYASAVLII